jgi:hypothetical protein
MCKPRYGSDANETNFHGFGGAGLPIGIASPEA